jgi:hypothetical protein
MPNKYQVLASYTGTVQYITFILTSPRRRRRPRCHYSWLGWRNRTSTWRFCARIWWQQNISAWSFAVEKVFITDAHFWLVIISGRCGDAHGTVSLSLWYVWAGLSGWKQIKAGLGRTLKWEGEVDNYSIGKTTRGQKDERFLRVPPKV